MPSTKYPGIALPRGIDPTIASVLQSMDAALRQMSAGPEPADALAVAGGQVDVGTGPAPSAGHALLAQTKRKAVWSPIPHVALSWERVDMTVAGVHLVYSCPFGQEWIPTSFLFRTHLYNYSAATPPTVSFGVIGGGYADVLPATALTIASASHSQTVLPKSPATNVQGGTPLYANISVAATGGAAMIDVYGIGILVPK